MSQQSQTKPYRTYEEYLRSDDWYRLRQEKLRAGIRDSTHAWCRGCKCMVPVKWIHIHHRTYKRLFNEKLSDLAILCEGCHAFLHGHQTPAWWDAARRRGALGSFSKKRLIQDIKSGLIGRNEVADAIIQMSIRIVDRNHIPGVLSIGEIMQRSEWVSEASIKARAAKVHRRKERLGIAT